MDRSALSSAVGMPDPARRASALVALLSDLDDYRSAVLAARDEAVRSMHAAGHSGTEIVAAVGITKGRVSQILHETDDR